MVAKKRKSTASLISTQPTKKKKNACLINMITNMKKGKKKHFGKKWRGYLKYWLDYLILGSGSPARLPGLSGDRRALLYHTIFACA